MRYLKFTLILFAIILMNCGLIIFPGELKANPKDNNFSADQIGLQDTIKTKQEIIDYLLNAKKILKEEKKERMRGVNIITSEVEPISMVISYEYNSEKLTSTAKEQLDELGGALSDKRTVDMAIKLEGHCDERGSAKYNLNLSEKRIQSAKEYIVKNIKIPANRISAVGYGESKPIVRNAKTEAEHALNRRVEIEPYLGEVIEQNIKKESKEVSETTKIRLKEKAKAKTKTEGLGVEWGIFHINEDGSEELIKYDGSSVLKSDDKFRVYVKPGSESYVYLYQADSKGNGSWLFPRKEVILKNPTFSRDNWMPSRTNSFTLDNNVGTETIYLVASKNAIPEIEKSMKAPSESIDTDAEMSKNVVSVIIGMRGIKEARNEDRGSDSNKIAELFSKEGEFFAKISFQHK